MVESKALKISVLQLNSKFENFFINIWPFFSRGALLKWPPVTFLYASRDSGVSSVSFFSAIWDLILACTASTIFKWSWSSQASNKPFASASAARNSAVNWTKKSVSQKNLTSALIALYLNCNKNRLVTRPTTHTISHYKKKWKQPTKSGLMIVWHAPSTMGGDTVTFCCVYIILRNRAHA